MTPGSRHHMLCPNPSAAMFALAALILVMLTGCSLFGKPASPFEEKAAVKVPVATVSDPTRKVLRVGLGQAGARVELGLDQQLQVRLLTAVALAPEWALVGHASGVVDAQGPTFEPDVRGNISGEVEGDTVWRIRPTAPGQVTLRFEYRRPRNTAPAVQVVTFDVVVR